MADRIIISGIQLHNYSVREYMSIARELMETEGFQMILEVTASDLVKASEEEKILEIFRNADELIIADSGILNAAGLEDELLSREIARMDFCMELMQMLEKNQKTAAVIGLSRSDTEAVQEMLSFEFPKLKVAGIATEDPQTPSADAAVNEINSTGADLLVSILPLEREADFLAAYKGRLSARIWYGIGPGRFEYSRPGIAGQLKKEIAWHILKSRMDVK